MMHTWNGGNNALVLNLGGHPVDEQQSCQYPGYHRPYDQVHYGLVPPMRLSQHRMDLATWSIDDIRTPALVVVVRDRRRRRVVTLGESDADRELRRRWPYVVSTCYCLMMMR